MIPETCHGAAVALADLGWSVFPVNGKIPYAGTRGCLDATRDVEIIAEWWTRWPDAGVGIATGAPSGVFAVDVDGNEGEATLRGLASEHGRLPTTVTARTRRGWHLSFSLGELDVRNSAGKVGAGLDVRGTGGYVVAPPSPHPDGGAYAWHRDPYEHAAADPPSWLVELVTARSEPVRELRAPLPPEPGDRGRYIEAAIAAECAELAATGEGQRNHQLNRSAWSLARFVTEGSVSRDEVARRLAHAAASAGLRTYEIERTIRSALSARGAA